MAYWLMNASSIILYSHVIVLKVLIIFLQKINLYKQPSGCDSGCKKQPA
jgi:hypothetical protein